MAEGGTLTFSDSDNYAAAFGDVRVNLTITGAGDSNARLTRLRLKCLEVHWCWESLPRIAFISVPPEQIFLSFPVGMNSPMFGRVGLRNGDIVFHSRGERLHQRSKGLCQWGLIWLSPDELASCAKALIGQPIASPHRSMILHPSRAETTRFHNLLRQACHLAEARRDARGGKGAGAGYASRHHPLPGRQ